LTEWRDNDFSWEHFGAVQPIRNADIWKRIDRTLAFHQVQCRWMAQEDASPLEATKEIKSNSLSSRANSSMGYGDPELSELSVATVKRAPTFPSQSSTRNHTVSGTSRSSISNIKNQRIYVDTPIQEVTAYKQESLQASTLEQSIESSPRTTGDRSTIQNKQDPKNGFFQSKVRFGKTSTRLRYVFFPFRILIQGPIWLCKRIWVGILAVDAWLEIFLRYLFLVNPKKHPFRR